MNNEFYECGEVMGCSVVVNSAVLRVFNWTPTINEERADKYFVRKQFVTPF